MKLQSEIDNNWRLNMEKTYLGSLSGTRKRQDIKIMRLNNITGSTEMNAERLLCLRATDNRTEWRRTVQSTLRDRTAKGRTRLILETTNIAYST